MVKNKMAARLCCIFWPGLSLSLSLSLPCRLGPIKAGPTCLLSLMPFILRVPLDPAGAGPMQLPLIFVFTVYSSYEGCSQGWMSQSICALASLPRLSLLELILAPHLPKDAVLKMLPCESSPFSPRDQHGCKFLRLWRGCWLSLHICSHSPADLVSWDWPDLGERLRASGPRVTAPFRTHYSL